ncbi:MAG: hypothetical protein ACE5OZ_18825 [Candidatus Heimdallarchaeota archaeon]
MFWKEIQKLFIWRNILSNSKNIEDVLHGLFNAERYQHNRLQLKVAAKLKRTSGGALTILFEPQINSRKGDIEVIFHKPKADIDFSKLDSEDISSLIRLLIF